MQFKQGRLIKQRRFSVDLAAKVAQGLDMADAQAVISAAVQVLIEENPKRGGDAHWRYTSINGSTVNLVRESRE